MGGGCEGREGAQMWRKGRGGWWVSFCARACVRVQYLRWAFVNEGGASAEGLRSNLWSTLVKYASWKAAV